MTTRRRFDTTGGWREQPQPQTQPSPTTSLLQTNPQEQDEKDVKHEQPPQQQQQKETALSGRGKPPRRRRLLYSFWCLVCITLCILLHSLQSLTITTTTMTMTAPLLLMPPSTRKLSPSSKTVNDRDEPLLLLPLETQLELLELQEQQQENNTTTTTTSGGHYFGFFRRILLPHWTTTAKLLDSESVDLRHCNLGLLSFGNFTRWAKPLLEKVERDYYTQRRHNHTNVQQLTPYEFRTKVLPEFALSLLEMYATHTNTSIASTTTTTGTHDAADNDPLQQQQQQPVCNFAKYNLTIRQDVRQAGRVLLAAALQQQQQQQDEFARLAIVIVAFRDVEHLGRIVRAVHMPQHYIVIHLERHSPASYQDEVHKTIVSRYNNVVVVRFGSVVYRSDSVSMINYQIMHWMVNELQLEYDYHVTLGGAVYPLYGPVELARHLKQSQRRRRRVWLGELLHNGRRLGNHTVQYGPLQRKRLYSTVVESKYRLKTKRSQLDGREGWYPHLPAFIENAMTAKTNSGNQAVFAHAVVEALTKSSRVKQLFATAKFGCCCCLEERTWIAALRLIGENDNDSLDAASMFQLWGGTDQCQASMNNAVLTMNPQTCFRNEDATLGSQGRNRTPQDNKKRRDDESSSALYMRGDQMFEALRQAKKRGFLFARKFRSDHAGSMELLQRIQSELHQDE